MRHEVATDVKIPYLEAMEQADVDANKQLIREHYEIVFNRKETHRLAEFVSPNITLHHSSISVKPGLEGIAQHQRSLFSGIPDMHYEVHDMLAEGDRVSARLTISGTHLGEYWGFPPTGKRVSMTTIQIVRIEGGKIMELWSEADVVGMRAQLGAAGQSSEPAE